MREAGKSLLRGMQSVGEADAALIEHEIEDLDDLPHESVDGVVPFRDPGRMTPHAYDDLGCSLA